MLTRDDGSLFFHILDAFCHNKINYGELRAKSKSDQSCVIKKTLIGPNDKNDMIYTFMVSC